MIYDIINRIQTELNSVFKQVDNWFDLDEALLCYNPYNGGWSVSRILEHVSLTNHFLLILIRKGMIKAIERSAATFLEPLLHGYDLDWSKLQAIGEHRAFKWNRPEHMEPAGTIPMYEVRARLKLQLAETIGCLNQLMKGEGILYKTTMSVNDLGKIDVYHYIYFLVQHAKRHLIQMENAKMEFEMTK
jgi:DinB superfamily